MIDRTLEKTDEALEGINDFLKTITNRITPNKILIVSFINGFIGALITTGFMGDNSISVLSFAFGLFIWQFIIICAFASAHVNLTTTYLNKFIATGVIGYAVQWQLFAMWALEYSPELAKLIEPIVDHSFGNFLFIMGCIYGLKACFSGNTHRKESLEKWTLKKQEKLDNKVS